MNYIMKLMAIATIGFGIYLIVGVPTVGEMLGGILIILSGGLWLIHKPKKKRVPIMHIGYRKESYGKDIHPNHRF